MRLLEQYTRNIQYNDKAATHHANQLNKQDAGYIAIKNPWSPDDLCHMLLNEHQSIALFSKGLPATDVIKLNILLDTVLVSQPHVNSRPSEAPGRSNATETCVCTRTGTMNALH